MTEFFDANLFKIFEQSCIESLARILDMIFREHQDHIRYTFREHQKVSATDLNKTGTFVKNLKLIFFRDNCNQRYVILGS